MQQQQQHPNPTNINIKLIPEMPKQEQQQQQQQQQQQHQEKNQSSCNLAIPKACAVKASWWDVYLKQRGKEEFDVNVCVCVSLSEKKVSIWPNYNRRWYPLDATPYIVGIDWLSGQMESHTLIIT